MRLAIAVVAIVIFAAAGTVVVLDTLRDVGTPKTIDNESVTPDSNYTSLAESDSELALYNDSDSVAVWNGTHNEVKPGGNWSWQQTNGSLKIVNNSYLDGLSTAKVTYGYVRQTPDQDRAEDIAALVPQMMGLMLPFGALVLFLVFARGM